METSLIRVLDCRAQVSAPLTALRTLGFFMQDRIRPSDETSQDLVDNIVLQGDRLSEVAVQLQASVLRVLAVRHERGRRV